MSKAYVVFQLKMSDPEKFGLYKSWSNGSGQWCQGSRSRTWFGNLEPLLYHSVNNRIAGA